MTVYVHMFYTNIRSLQQRIVKAVFTTSSLIFYPRGHWPVDNRGYND